MTPYYDQDGITIHHGDCRTVLAALPAASVNCCVTSPPYFGLRDYGDPLQIGLEETPDAYVAEMVALFRNVRRVLKDDGTLWLNLGDSYNAYNVNRGPSKSLSAPANVARPDIGGKRSNHHRSHDDGSEDTEHNGGRDGLAADNLRGGSIKFLERGLTVASRKPKDLIGIPWRVAFALQAYGWYLRQDIIWNKPNPMPESVTDRCTKAHEYVFLLSKPYRG